MYASLSPESTVENILLRDIVASGFCSICLMLIHARPALAWRASSFSPTLLK